MPDRPRASLLGVTDPATQLPDRLPETGTLFVDLTDIDEATVRGFLQDVAGFPALTVSDALRLRHPPKFEAVDDDRYLLLLRGF